MLLDDFGLKKGDIVADPFMGSGTTALVSILNGYNSIGFDILPMSQIAIKAKTLIYKYDLTELQRMLDEIALLDVPQGYSKKTPEISITKMDIRQ